MVRPFRLLMIAALAMLIYMGFFAVPGNMRSETAFNPDELAARELAVWQSAQARDEFGTLLNTTLMLREQYRYPWARAGQASYYLGRATVQFVDFRTRFERVLPDLEDAAAVEKSWRQARFDPKVVARAQLNWMATSRMPTLNNTEDVAALMAEEYGLRYDLDPGNFLTAATYRAEAIKVRDESKVDPDWPTIKRLLVESYRSLHQSIQDGRTRQTLRRR
jgi:hypothetical protein